MNRLDEVKAIIRFLAPFFDCGIFNTRNIVGDHMETVYEKDGVKIDVCNSYSYLEVFGLTCDEYNELEAYYNTLRRVYRERTDELNGIF